MFTPGDAASVLSSPLQILLDKGLSFFFSGDRGAAKELRQEQTYLLWQTSEKVSSSEEV